MTAAVLSGPRVFRSGVTAILLAHAHNRHEHASQALLSQYECRLRPNRTWTFGTTRDLRAGRLTWTWKGSKSVTLTPIKKCVIWDSTPTCCGCQVANPTSCILRPIAGTCRVNRSFRLGVRVRLQRGCRRTQTWPPATRAPFLKSSPARRRRQRPILVQACGLLWMGRKRSKKLR